jgi:hypothetical protein
LVVRPVRTDGLCRVEAIRPIACIPRVDVDDASVLYLGVPRLSCVFCIFASREALTIAGHHNRELLDEYVRVETAIGHTFRTDTTLMQIKAAVDAGEMPAKGQINGNSARKHIALLGRVYTEAVESVTNPYHAMQRYLLDIGMPLNRAAAVVIEWTCKYGTVSSNMGDLI